MNKETPHAMKWSLHHDEYGGKEMVATIAVRLRYTDSTGLVPDKEMLDTLRQQMAEVMDCPVERINTYCVNT